MGRAGHGIYIAVRWAVRYTPGCILLYSTHLPSLVFYAPGYHPPSRAAPLLVSTGDNREYSYSSRVLVGVVVFEVAYHATSTKSGPGGVPSGPIDATLPQILQVTLDECIPPVR